MGREGAGLGPASRPRLTGLGDTRYNLKHRTQNKQFISVALGKPIGFLGLTHCYFHAHHTHGFPQPYRAVVHLYCISSEDVVKVGNP